MANKILTRQEVKDKIGGGEITEPNRLCTIVYAEQIAAGGQTTEDNPTQPDWLIKSWGFTTDVDNPSVQDAADSDDQTEYGYRPTNYQEKGSFLNPHNTYIKQDVAAWNITATQHNHLYLLWPEDPVTETGAYHDEKSAYINGYIYNDSEYDVYIPKKQIRMRITVGFGGNYLDYSDYLNEPDPLGLCYINWGMWPGMQDYKWWLAYSNYGGNIATTVPSRSYTSLGTSLGSYTHNNGYQFDVQFLVDGSGEWYMAGYDYIKLGIKADDGYALNDIWSDLDLVAVSPIEITRFSATLTYIE